MTKDFKGSREVKKAAKKAKEKGRKDSQKPVKTVGTGKQPNENAFGVLQESDDNKDADGRS